MYPKNLTCEGAIEYLTGAKKEIIVMDLCWGNKPNKADIVVPNNTCRF